jgi:hypothetical protein
MDAHGWDPAWDEPEVGGSHAPGATQSAKQPQSWDAFFSECKQRTDAAMRAAGVDPSRCVATSVKAVAWSGGKAWRHNVLADSDWGSL